MAIFNSYVCLPEGTFPKYQTTVVNAINHPIKHPWLGVLFNHPIANRGIPHNLYWIYSDYRVIHWSFPQHWVTLASFNWLSSRVSWGPPRDKLVIGSTSINYSWLVVSTPMKIISQIGSSSQLLGRKKTTCSKPPTSIRYAPNQLIC